MFPGGGTIGKWAGLWAAVVSRLSLVTRSAKYAPVTLRWNCGRHSLEVAVLRRKSWKNHVSANSGQAVGKAPEGQLLPEYFGASSVVIIRCPVVTETPLRIKSGNQRSLLGRRL